MQNTTPTEKRGLSSIWPSVGLENKNDSRPVVSRFFLWISYWLEPLLDTTDLIHWLHMFHVLLKRLRQPVGPWSSVLWYHNDTGNKGTRRLRIMHKVQETKPWLAQWVVDQLVVVPTAGNTFAFKSVCGFVWCWIQKNLESGFKVHIYIPRAFRGPDLPSLDVL